MMLTAMVLASIVGVLGRWKAWEEDVDCGPDGGYRKLKALMNVWYPVE